MSESNSGFDRNDEDPFKDSAFEDTGDTPLETPDGGDLDEHTGEKGSVPLGYQGLGKGSTPAEEEAGDTLDERLQREEPDRTLQPDGEQTVQLAGVSDAGRQDREGQELGIDAGSPADPDGDILDADDEPSAEEAAIHVVDEDEAG